MDQTIGIVMMIGVVSTISLGSQEVKSLATVSQTHDRETRLSFGMNHNVR